MIPILDLTAQYRSLKDQIDAAISQVLASGVFISGPNVDAFEEEIATYLGVRYAVSLNSGTDALHVALRALGIGSGDEVVTSPFTFIATTEAISIVGATPVFVDINPVTFNIDPAAIAAAITPRTRAILPIHLYGQPADMEAIQSIALRYGLAVIEDCAQAIGSAIGSRKAGSVGDVGCFSFFPTKNLGAYGDGGLVTTNDANLSQRMRVIRQHGGRQKYHHEVLGINSRLDELQAAILRVKLPYLDRWVAARQKIAQNYTKAFIRHPAITPPFASDHSTHAYHQYTVRVEDRDGVRSRLATAGVQSMVYYPVPLHRQPVYADRFLVGSFPRAERAAEEVLSLPMFPELARDVQTTVINEVEHATSGSRTAV